MKSEVSQETRLTGNSLYRASMLPFHMVPKFSRLEDRLRIESHCLFVLKKGGRKVANYAHAKVRRPIKINVTVFATI